MLFAFRHLIIEYGLVLELFLAFGYFDFSFFGGCTIILECGVFDGPVTLIVLVQSSIKIAFFCFAVSVNRFLVGFQFTAKIAIYFVESGSELSDFGVAMAFFALAISAFFFLISSI